MQACFAVRRCASVEPIEIEPKTNDDVEKILVVDLEATCSDDGSIAPEEMEIIEIGACWATESGVVLQRFQHFVRPLQRPILTPFCKSLTGTPHMRKWQWKICTER